MLADTVHKGGNEPKAQLEPLGIDRLDSQRWQAVVAISAERFEREPCAGSEPCVASYAVRVDVSDREKSAG